VTIICVPRVLLSALAWIEEFCDQVFYLSYFGLGSVGAITSPASFQTLFEGTLNSNRNGTSSLFDGSLILI